MHDDTSTADSRVQAFSDGAQTNPLSLELARLDHLFARHLAHLREAGRSSLGDAVGGAVIEDGEAEGLLSGLFDTHSQSSDPSAQPDGWTSPLAGLERARRRYRLLPVERDLLLLGLSVEIDSRYARLVAYLNDHVAMTRPTVGLAMALLLPNHDRARSEFVQRLVADGPLRLFELIELEGDGPVATRAVKLPEHFWPRLIGIRCATRFVPSHDKPDAAECVFTGDVEAQLAAVASWLELQSRSSALVIVAGEAGSGRDLIARLAASNCSRCWFEISADELATPDSLHELARECAWHDAAVIVRNADGLGAQAQRKLQSLCPTPVLLVTDIAHDGKLLEAATRNCTQITVPTFEAGGRVDLWRQLARLRAVQIDAARLAGRFGFGPGRIDQALRLAGTDVIGGGHEFAVEQVCRRMQRAQFRDLAEKLPCPFKESDIVLPAKTHHELDLICTWAEHGPALFGETGIGRSLHTGQGLVCLFSGPPGTGKTMAAQVIAKRIGFDVYRIDLSQVVNKYVGETEKNLARVFDEAQRSKVILFFDEAETLYGDRSEVKTAQDRFANIEIGYLLQRIETFEGVAILATNLQKNLDEAFLRRLSICAEFPMPGPEERQLIWSKLLPAQDQCADDIDIDLLSRQFNIAGGDIRNAIFSALLLAAEEQSLLSMTHLARGLWRELQKSGRVVDTAQFGAWREFIQPVAAGKHSG